VLILFSRFRTDPQAVLRTIADAIETQGSALVGAVTVIAPDRIRRKMP
jgi:hypothetical protein